MKIIITLTLIVASFATFAQKSDTVSTTITFGEKNVARFKQLDDQQKKIDSAINVQRNELLDVILSAHGINIKELVKIEPKPNGTFVIKTKKK